MDFIKKNGFSIAGKMVMEKENGNKTVMEVLRICNAVSVFETMFITFSLSNPGYICLYPDA